MPRHFTAYQSFVWGTTSFRLFWSCCLLWAPFDLFLYCKKRWKIGLSPSWATHDFITFCDIPLGHIFLCLSYLWLLRSHLCRRCYVLLITVLLFFPTLEQKYQKCTESSGERCSGDFCGGIVLFFWGLFLVDSITAGCLLSCGLILTQWVFRLLP